MSNAKQARSLRRTIEQLSRCCMDDIEWIWSTLDVAQRQRLGPLLIEARPDWAAKPRLDDAVDTAHVAPNANSTPKQLSRLICHLSGELANRVFACLDDEQRRLVAAQLPSSHAKARVANIRMTKRAQQALLQAAYATADDLPIHSMSRQPAWRRLLQRKVRE